MNDAVSPINAEISVLYRLVLVDALNKLPEQESYSNEEIRQAIDTAIQEQSYFSSNEMRAAASQFYTDFVTGQDNASLNAFIDTTKESAGRIGEAIQGIAPEILANAMNGGYSVNMLPYADKLGAIQGDITTFEQAGSQYLGLGEAGFTGLIESYYQQNRQEAERLQNLQTANDSQQPEQEQHPIIEILMMFFSMLLGIEPANVIQQEEQPQEQQMESTPQQPGMDRALLQANGETLSGDVEVYPEEPISVEPSPVAISAVTPQRDQSFTPSFG